MLPCGVRDAVHIRMVAPIRLSLCALCILTKLLAVGAIRPIVRARSRGQNNTHFDLEDDSTGAVKRSTNNVIVNTQNPPGLNT